MPLHLLINPRLVVPSIVVKGLSSFLLLSICGLWYIWWMPENRKELGERDETRR